MTYAQRFSGAALVVGVVMVWGSGAGADPPDGYAPNPPSPPTPPTLTMSTPEVVEGTGGPNEMVFTFELDKPASGGESFRFFTEDAQGSALPVEDHEPMLEFPDFGPGDTELTVGIPIVTDDVPEANEHILVQMDHPMGLTIVDGSGTGVILDDDIPTLTIDDVTAAEGTGGPTGFHFTVALSEPSTVDVYVSATPTAGSAMAATDWQGLPQLVQFAPGETSHDVVVSVVGDGTPEADETFTVELSDADYATIADGTGLGTIVNDDELDKAATPTTTAPQRTTTTTPKTTTSPVIRTAAIDATLAASDEQSPALDLRPAAAVGLIVLAALSLLAAWRVRQGG